MSMEGSNLTWKKSPKSEPNKSASDATSQTEPPPTLVRRAPLPGMPNPRDRDDSNYQESKGNRLVQNEVVNVVECFLVVCSTFLFIQDELLSSKRMLGSSRSSKQHHEREECEVFEDLEEREECEDPNMSKANV